MPARGSLFARKWENESGTPTYHSWADMRRRCLNPEYAKYHNHGGRGISIDPNWVDNYDQFVADMGFRPKGLTLERKDNEGNYTPDNCIWATYAQQNRNRRGNNKITFQEKTQTITDWAKEVGLSVRAIQSRVDQGMPLERVLDPKPLIAPSEHGSKARYTLGCRCDACREASSAKKRDWYARNPGQSKKHYYRMKEEQPERFRELQEKTKEYNRQRRAAKRAEKSGQIYDL